MTTQITLCAVPYEVTDQDGQVIFKNASGFPGLSTFTFEWTGCGWYIVDMQDWAGAIFVPHIVAAYEWVSTNYHIAWNDGVGKVSPK